MRESLEFIELQRPVVDSRRQSEPIFHKIHLAGEVAAVHAADLREGDMALINDCEVVFGEIVEQTEWAHAGLPAIEIAGIVFDTAAMSQFLNHLEVVGYTLAQSLGLEQFTFVAEKLALSAEIDSNLVDGACRVLFRRHEDIGRIYVESVKLRQNGSRFRIHRADTFNFITPENNA